MDNSQNLDERNLVTCTNCGDRAGLDLLDAWCDPDREIRPWTCPHCRD